MCYIVSCDEEIWGIIGEWVGSENILKVLGDINQIKKINLFKLKTIIY